MLIGKLSQSLTSARLEHERLTSLINSMADGVLAVDNKVQVVIYNGAALNILNRNDPIEHKSLGSFLQPVGKDNKPVDIVELVKSTRVATSNRDLRLKYNDGSTINLYISIAPVHLGYGEIGGKGYVILLRDITREKSLEEERDEFISVVSHELRTPIAITEGNISNAQFIAEKSGDMAEVKRALSEAYKQVLFLSDLINDLSALSRAERGKLPDDIGPINVPELIGELIDNYTPETTGKHLKLHADVDEAVESLSSSKLYVREMLQNFITNALKYTEHGSITVSAKKQEGGVRFTVTDTGIGISKSDQGRVFEKFFRSGDYRTRQANGTGLGLYVTAKLARLLNSQISFTSELNKGSAFTVFVPDLQPPKPKAN